MGEVLGIKGLKQVRKEDMMPASIYKVFDLDSEGALDEWTVTGLTELSMDTSAPLGKKRSLKYTQVAGSLVGDKAVLNPFIVPEQATKISDHIFRFRNRLNNAGNGDFKISVLGALSAERVSILFQNNEYTVVKLFSYRQEDVSMSVQLQVMNVNAGASVTIDAIEFSDDAISKHNLELKETITFTNFASKNANNLIKYLTLMPRSSSANEVIQEDNTGDHTKITAIRSCDAILFANHSSDSEATQITIQLYDKDDVLIPIDPRHYQAAIGGTTLPFRMNEGDYAVVYHSGGNNINDTRSIFSIQASATRSYNIIPLTKKQSHDTGAAVWSYSASSEWVHSAGANWSSMSTNVNASSPLTSGDIEVPDNQKLEISLEASRGSYSFDIGGGLIYAQGADAAIRLHNVTDGTFSAHCLMNAAGDSVGTFSGRIEVLSNGPKVFEIQGYNDLRIYNGHDFRDNFTMAFTYMPPVDQANSYELTALPQIEDNDLEIVIQPDGTLISGNTKLMTMSTVSSVSTLDYSALGLTSLPTLSITPVYDAPNAFMHRLLTLTTTNATMAMNLDQDNAERGIVRTSPTYWVIKLSKQGADRLGRGVLLADPFPGVTHKEEKVWSGDTWIDDRKIYSQSFEWSGSSISTSKLMGSIGSGKTIINLKSNAREGALWYEGALSSNFVTTYDDSTGDVTFAILGGNWNHIVTTVQYVE